MRRLETGRRDFAEESINRYLCGVFVYGPSGLIGSGLVIQ